MGRQLADDDGSTLLYVTLITVSRQFGGGLSTGLVALLYSPIKLFLTLLVECLIISTLAPLVSATLFRSSARCCPDICVLVSSTLTRGAPQATSATTNSSKDWVNITWPRLSQSFQGSFPSRQPTR